MMKRLIDKFISPEKPSYYDLPDEQFNFLAKQDFFNSFYEIVNAAHSRGIKIDWYPGNQQISIGIIYEDDYNFDIDMIIDIVGSVFVAIKSYKRQPDGHFKYVREFVSPSVKEKFMDIQVKDDF